MVAMGITMFVSHLPCALPPNQSVICLAPCHQTSQSFALPLPPNQSVIWLAPYHQTRQSFDLPSTTVAPWDHINMSLDHHGTASLCHCITASLRHLISQSFDMPPATKPGSHLTCPLPPCHCVTMSPFHHVIVSPITMSLHHRITASPNRAVIWFALYHCGTASLCHQITASPHHHATLSPCHCITASLHHCISQSFALPPATKPVSHLPCPLTPNQAVIWLALYHCGTEALHHWITGSQHHHVGQSFDLPSTTASPRHHITASPHHHSTALVSHLTCPLPPNQSVICLAPCHQTRQSFDMPSTTTALRHCITGSPRHCISQSFALPPATKPVSHLPCPLPPN